MGLVFLLVLTIFGISSLSTTLLEEKMAANIQEQNRAFQTAEAGLTRKTINICNSMAWLSDTSESDCDSTDPANPSKTSSNKCKVSTIGPAMGRGSGFRGGGAESHSLCGPFGGAMPYGSRVFDWRIQSTEVNAAKARATVNLGVAIIRPGDQQTVTSTTN